MCSVPNTKQSYICTDQSTQDLPPRIIQQQLSVVDLQRPSSYQYQRFADYIKGSSPFESRGRCERLRRGHRRIVDTEFLLHIFAQEPLGRHIVRLPGARSSGTISAVVPGSMSTLRRRYSSNDAHRKLVVVYSLLCHFVTHVDENAVLLLCATTERNEARRLDSVT